MLETERSSDEALRQPTFRRLYLGAFKIPNEERRLRACLIILLAGRVGLRTGEIQHFCEEWVDWDRGSIAIPQHHPCACYNCWIRANQQAARDEDTARARIRGVVEEYIASKSDRSVDKIIDDLFQDDEDIEEAAETEPTNDEVVDGITENSGSDGDDEDHGDVDTRSAEKILYEERWQPKYARSARRVPFGHSRRLTAVIIEFIRQQDYLNITQEAMRNHVQEAAEYADGVNPENVTIRGLRATAATHYATYIRNPKILQDLMGWTRLETAARYLRRSGATTTDIVYAAFKQHDLRPAMFAEEPEEKFPIIDNPLPYDDEPYDPMQFHKDRRREFGKERFDHPRRVIHPRSHNYPDDFNYDPDEHAILTHEDFEDDITERTGLVVFEKPTIADIFDDHPRIRESEIVSDDSQRLYKDEDEWEENNLMQTKLEEIDEEEGTYRSQLRDPITVILNWFFGLVDRGREWLESKLVKWFPTDAFDPRDRKPVKYIFGISGVVFILSLLVFGMFRVGLITATSTFPYFKFVIAWKNVLTIAVVVYVLNSLPKSESLQDIFQ